MPGPASDTATGGTLRIREGGSSASLPWERVEELLSAMLDGIGPLRRVLLVPPDYTRRHSGAGEIACILWHELHRRGAEHVAVLPALGTHVPMPAAQLASMYPGIPLGAFVPHRWRTDVRALGEVPGSFVSEISEGRVDYGIRCEVNRLLLDEPWDRIFSIGQLVPHEVAGIANHAKNVFVGAGGRDSINKTHFLGAVCGMEQAMGRADTPVRRVFDYMGAEFAAHLPITYVLTVRAPQDGGMATRGLFAGEGRASFLAGAGVCQQSNLSLLDEPIRRAVVFLDPEEFHSTWLGNKAIYRLRMAMADGGELTVLAPGVSTFGEDKGIDALIRRHGYRTTPEVLDAVRGDAELGDNLAAAAHLIHGSPEGRFRVVYATEHLTRAEVEGVGYEWRSLHDALAEFDPERLRDGFNDGPSAFFVSNPALGLWALKRDFPAGEAAP